MRIGQFKAATGIAFSQDGALLRSFLSYIVRIEGNGQLLTITAISEMFEDGIAEGDPIPSYELIVTRSNETISIAATRLKDNG